MIYLSNGIVLSQIKDYARIFKASGQVKKKPVIRDHTLHDFHVERDKSDGCLEAGEQMAEATADP